MCRETSFVYKKYRQNWSLTLLLIVVSMAADYLPLVVNIMSPPLSRFVHPLLPESPGLAEGAAPIGSHQRPMEGHRGQQTIPHL